MKKLLFPLFLFSVVSLSAQIRNADVFEIPEMVQDNTRGVIRIPDTQGYKVLKCDFHVHTVFSDGQVWPSLRINEAWSDGLDALAITDHIEYRPWLEYLKGDFNSSYNIAKPTADQLGMILIKGSEITRAKPLGHINALFIQDANPLNTPDPIDAVNEAYKQGAFIMWNHPGWPDDLSTKYEIHDQLIKEGKIHGIEVFNDIEYYPKSFDWARDLKLAFMGNSDIHGTTALHYGTEKLARPITLVFAKERSEAGIREALFAGRSLALFHGELAGPKELLTDLIKASFEIKVVKSNETTYNIELSNLSDIPYQATSDGKLILLPANSTVQVTLPKKGKVTFLNCHTGNGQLLEIEYPF